MAFEIFLVAPPGLETVLADEARAAGFTVTGTLPGGVTLEGGWPDVWRANLSLRGATRVLARIGTFRAFHLAQLDKRARKFDWASVLRPDVPVRVEASTKRSKIYHAGAATQRIERAIGEELGAPIAADAPVQIKARIDDNLVTLSVDTSGESLHKRGHKLFTGKAPMRETLASLMLRACGYTGAEPVLDPMCGSGTFPIEAAEIAAGLLPGRDRGFAFEHLAGFDAAAFAAMKDVPRRDTALRFYGSDRDAGAVRGATENAERAGVGALTRFTRAPVSEVARPDDPPGLVFINPPYGGRIGDRKLLFGLHGALGTVLRERFAGWRVGLVTNDGGLAKATGLPFLPPGPPIAHGGLKVTLYRTDPL
ncbi:THUMP domain-containing class I SAM-dependent RNA methyltransferase [Sinisalibacter aestuarii]|uniref:RNA methyltransferase n=1 Tax=Sinisalibacter aestuarii TaxID=2949426 RepID=A0ABQ5LRL2_9RHOB|nr:class I SAM-dependent RNA methyltransferase [Sinisalibacter aestuarii]GKY86722.1 RNA methyltransferase [Sinisalibacter aestuarii]